MALESFEIQQHFFPSFRLMGVMALKDFAKQERKKRLGASLWVDIVHFSWQRSIFAPQDMLCSKRYINLSLLHNVHPTWHVCFWSLLLRKLICPQHFHTFQNVLVVCFSSLGTVVVGINSPAAFRLIWKHWQSGFVWKASGYAACS